MSASASDQGVRIDIEQLGLTPEMASIIAGKIGAIAAVLTVDYEHHGAQSVSSC